LALDPPSGGRLSRGKVPKAGLRGILRHILTDRPLRPRNIVSAHLQSRGGEGSGTKDRRTIVSSWRRNEREELELSLLHSTEDGGHLVELRKLCRPLLLYGALSTFLGWVRTRSKTADALLGQCRPQGRCGAVLRSVGHRQDHAVGGSGAHASGPSEI
jgi:hypothetical protein